jgi:hypothetical protein
MTQSKRAYDGFPTADWKSGPMFFLFLRCGPMLLTGRGGERKPRKRLAYRGSYAGWHSLNLRSKVFALRVDFHVCNAHYTNHHLLPVRLDLSRGDQFISSAYRRLRRSSPVMWHLGHGGGVDLGSHQWGLHFSSFRIKVWWGGAQMVATASSLIKFPVFGPILVATRSLWELCGSQEGDPWSFIGDYSFFFVSEMNAVFLTRSTTSRQQPTMLG